MPIPRVNDNWDRIRVRLAQEEARRDQGMGGDQAG